MRALLWSLPIFFFNDPATTEIYTLSLHDALPISFGVGVERTFPVHSPILQKIEVVTRGDVRRAKLDRKSTRLNSSHSQISYAVFCLKKKKKSTPAQPHSAQRRRRTPRAASEVGCA